MYGRFLKLKKCMPIKCYKTFEEINFNTLYESGKRVLMVDLDNTLLPYDISIPSENIINLIKNLKQQGFSIYLVSNNHKERVSLVAKYLQISCIYHALKPLGKSFNKVLRTEKCKKSQIVAIGDQIITDVYGSGRKHIDCILVHPIKKSSEKWYTRLNRHNELLVLNRMKKKYNEKYKEIILNCED